MAYAVLGPIPATLQCQESAAMIVLVNIINQARDEESITSKFISKTEDTEIG
jgi:hypothetical protein